MPSRPTSGRRQFLKGSAIVGAAIPFVPALAQEDAGRAPGKTAGPTGAVRNAEVSASIEDTEASQLVDNPGSDFMVDLLKHSEIK